MNEEILDNEFYEEEEIFPRIWWESRRLKYNKICLSYAAIIFIIALFCDVGDEIGLVVGMSVSYWVCGNIAYTFSWILENLLFKITDFRLSENIRNFIFWLGIGITFLFPTFIIYLLISTVHN